MESLFERWVKIHPKNHFVYSFVYSNKKAAMIIIS
jgi:hypothetical protein